MFNSNGYSLADIAAATGGNNRNNGDGMFGDNGWWIILLFLFTGWGRGYGGFGGGIEGGFGGGFSPCATQADVRAAVDQQTLISKLDQQTYGLADSTYALNSAIVNGFNGVDNAICTLGFQTQTGFTALGSQLAQCCCDTQRAIDGVNYNMAKGFCDLGNVVQNTTRDIIDNQNANSRAILDFLTQDKIATLTAENQSLKFAASQASQNAFITANQEAQTAELIRRLSTPCPVPAYVVPNPNCCYDTLGYGLSRFNSGCNCG